MAAATLAANDYREMRTHMPEAHEMPLDADAKRLAEMGVARIVPMFPPEKADKVLPIIDRWTNIMRQVSR